MVTSGPRPAEVSSWSAPLNGDVDAGHAAAGQRCRQLGIRSGRGRRPCPDRTAAPPRIILWLDTAAPPLILVWAMDRAGFCRALLAGALEGAGAGTPLKVITFGSTAADVFLCDGPRSWTRELRSSNTC